VLSSENRTPVPRRGRRRVRAVLRAGKLEEDEAPQRGVPSSEEMSLHYGTEPWSFFARLALKRNGLTWRWSAPESSAPQTQAFTENEPPVAGLPNLCGEYDLPPLQLGHLPRAARP
jgi:hypothetical protein